MRKLDLILENIRDEFMINLLEEGSVSELETLKTKKFLNENLQRIRGILIQEGAMDSVKSHLANNWGKYLAGAGAAGTAYGLGNTETGGEIMDQLNMQNSTIGERVAGAGEVIGDKLGDAYDSATGTASDAVDAAKLAGGNLYDATGRLVDQAHQAIDPNFQPGATGAVDGNGVYGQYDAPVQPTPTQVAQNATSIVPGSVLGRA